MSKSPLPDRKAPPAQNVVYAQPPPVVVAAPQPVLFGGGYQPGLVLRPPPAYAVPGNTVVVQGAPVKTTVILNSRQPTMAEEMLHSFGNAVSRAADQIQNQTHTQVVQVNFSVI